MFRCSEPAIFCSQTYAHALITRYHSILSLQTLNSCSWLPHGLEALAWNRGEWSASPKWRPNHEFALHPDRSESTRGTSLSQRDSNLSYEIEASGQPIQDGAQTLKSHSIQKDVTRICVLQTSNAIYDIILIERQYPYSSKAFYKNFLTIFNLMKS